MAQFEVLKAFKSGGKRYEIGDKPDLDAKAAAGLPAGLVRPVEAEEPLKDEAPKGEPEGAPKTEGKGKGGK